MWSCWLRVNVLLRGAVGQLQIHIAKITGTHVIILDTIKYDNALACHRLFFTIPLFDNGS